MSPQDALHKPGDAQMLSLEHARSLDATDPLRHLRSEFLIPTRSDLSRRTLSKNPPSSGPEDDDRPSTYLCGNSLGLQPRRVRAHIETYLDTWAQKGVYGHFKPLSDSLAPPWVDADEAPKTSMARIVGAEKHEVVAMQSLTVNLHLLMCSFYQPTKERWKIIIEAKAFPSDHFAVESQLHHYRLPLSTSLVLIEPPDPSSPYLPTQHILDTITAHASTTALLLLPGIHFYSGQALDIPRITAHAHSHGIAVGWDLAHAVGNIPLQLHDWDVDFAAWCTYKYLNAGPGNIGGLFVHQKHGAVDQPPTKRTSALLGGPGVLQGSASAGAPDPTDTGPASATIGPHKSNILNILDPRVLPDLSKQKSNRSGPTDTDPASKTAGPHKSSILNALDPRVHPDPTKQKGPPTQAQAADAQPPDGAQEQQESPPIYVPRLSGWWGSDKTRRFAMANQFVPMPGASGWQLSNPSVLDIAALQASLAVFDRTTVPALRAKSERLTAYLEALLLRWPVGVSPRPYRLITPLEPAERGAQISVLLDDGLLEGVMRYLEAEGVVVDERRPNVVRVAPAPLYNSFEDVWTFMNAFAEALQRGRKDEVVAVKGGAPGEEG